MTKNQNKAGKATAEPYSESLQIILSLSRGNSPAIGDTARLNQIRIQAEKSLREHAALRAVADAAEAVKADIKRIQDMRSTAWMADIETYVQTEPNQTRLTNSLAKLSTLRGGKAVQS